MLHEVFFRPGTGWVGDVIPFATEDQLCLYHLYETRSEPRTGMPWHLVTTSDLVHYRDEGEVLSSGGPDAEDFNAYTGSVVRDDEGLYHLFYKANNPDRLAPDGRSLQLVAHATSSDLRHWRKQPQDTFGAPAGLDPADWRDPFVYRTPGRPGWTLILAARRSTGPDRRGGIVARLESDDLATWRPVTPLWEPNRFITQECPEVFRWGKWWYLVYSEFTDRFVTRYRMSTTPDGPWSAPRHDTLDGRGFYAAKSVMWQGRRIFFGWIASREDDHDDGAWLWGGTMAALEARQAADGTLLMCLPDEVLNAYSVPFDSLSSPISLGSVDSYSCLPLTEMLPDDVRISIDLSWAPQTREVGLWVRCDEAGETGYVLRLEPNSSRLVLDRWPRRVHGSEQWQISGDIPHLVELERPCDLSSGRAHLELILRGELLQCCINQEVCLSTPLHDHAHGRLAVSSLDGRVTCEQLTLHTRP